jgi:hypothetical protein
MKKIMLIGTMVVLAVIVGVAGLHAQAAVPGGTSPGGSGQPGYGPQGPQGWSCPGWGPGMMQGGWGMGPGMMYRGWGMGPGMMYGYGYGPQYQQRQSPLEKKDAETMVQNYLNATRNPNLKLGKIKEEGSTFEAEIVTKNGSLVDQLLIDKNTGWMRSGY